MTLYIILYLIGSILAYGLTVGIYYSMDEPYIEQLPPTYKTARQIGSAWFMAVFSWFGVLVTYTFQLVFRKKTVIKFSYRDLWLQYYSKNR